MNVNFIDDTKAFFQPYDKLLKIYVKTTLTEECNQKLQDKGVLILTGIQGSGKTLTAMYIMNGYEGWTKLKCTSWTDLLVFDFEEKTLVYIDNLFDGHIYRPYLQRWWDALWFFYFTYVQCGKQVRLLITAKDCAFQKASAHKN